MRSMPKLRSVVFDDVLFCDRLTEAGPPRADATEESMIMEVPGVAGVDSLGAGVARHLVEDGRDLLLPFGVDFGDSRDDNLFGLLNFWVELNNWLQKRTTAGTLTIRRVFVPFSFGATAYFFFLLDDFDVHSSG